MEVGAISEVVKTPLGLHLLQKTAEEGAGETAALEDVRDSVRDLLLHHRRGEALTKAVDQMKKRAVIEDDGEFDRRLAEGGGGGGPPV